MKLPTPPSRRSLSEGYMLGDYLGHRGIDQPGCARGARLGRYAHRKSRPVYHPCRDCAGGRFHRLPSLALSLAQINDPQLGGPDGDADSDAEDNLSEFLSGTEPNDPASVVHTSRQLNISTRETVGTDENVLIGGLIVSGSTAKQVILRAIGPSLAAFGLSGVLQDPTLALHDNTGAIIFSNDNWRETLWRGPDRRGSEVSPPSASPRPRRASRTSRRTAPRRRARSCRCRHRWRASSTRRGSAR